MQKMVLLTFILCIAAWISWNNSSNSSALDKNAPLEIRYTKHATERMLQRGANDNEVRETILRGEEVPAKDGKHKFEKFFPCNCERNGEFHKDKKLEVVAKREQDEWVIITVIADYY